jgi:ribosomal protein S3AE
MATKKSDKDKLKKKRWLPIISPELFGNEPIGESLVTNVEEMMGKPLTTNMMNLTSEIKKQNINVKFKVMSLKENTAVAELIGYHVSPSSIRRLVRRRHNRLDDSYKYTTSDNVVIQIKTLLITKTKTHRSTGSAIKKLAQKTIALFVKERPYLVVCKAILTGELQDTLRKTLSKIYPLKICDIRVFQLISGVATSQSKTEEPAVEEAKAE